MSLISKYVFYSCLIILTIVLAGCEKTHATRSMPEEGPQVVVERFYGYITEAKLKGGASPAAEAYKLISSERSQLHQQQFLEIIKKYPPGFVAAVGEAKIDGDQALVGITYEMPSMFGGTYKVDAAIPLTIDQATNTWRVDFTGETVGESKDELLAKYSEGAQGSR